MKVPKVGDIITDKYDAQERCHVKEWVSGVKSDNDKLLITHTRTKFFKPGAGHHDFYSIDPPRYPGSQYADDSQRKCKYCKCTYYKPLKFGQDPEKIRAREKRAYDEPCPVEQLHTHKTTQKQQRFYVVNGPKAGKFLTEEEAGDAYVSYNRSSRWRQKEGPHKVVLLALSTLKQGKA